MKLKEYQVYRVVNEPFQLTRQDRLTRHLIAYEKATMEFNPIAFGEEDRLIVVKSFTPAKFPKGYTHLDLENLWECYRLTTYKMDLDTVRYYAEDTDLAFVMYGSEITQYCLLDVLNTFKLQKQVQEDVEQTDT